MTDFIIYAIGVLVLIFLSGIAGGFGWIENESSAIFVGLLVILWPLTIPVSILVIALTGIFLAGSLLGNKLRERAEKDGH